MKILLTKLSLALFLAGGIALTGSTLTAASPPRDAATLATEAANLRTLLELTRSDLKTQKAVVVADNLLMTADEAAEFWPVHREYEIELSKLGDQKLALIVRYASNLDSMTNTEARELVKGSLDLETKRTELKRKFFAKFAKVIPAIKAARFFQIENQLNTVIDLQMAAALPLIK